MLTGFNHKVISLMLNSVHVYDPLQFDMYNNCPTSLLQRKILEPKHNADFFFTKSVLSKKFKPFTTTKDEANLFIIPVYCSQSSIGNCGNHTENINQLHEVLSKSKYFLNSNGSDHLIVCDYFRRKEVINVFPNILIGASVAPEKDEKLIAVADTTYLSLNLTKNNLKPLEKRKFDVLFSGQTNAKFK